MSWSKLHVYIGLFEQNIQVVTVYYILHYKDWCYDTRYYKEYLYRYVIRKYMYILKHVLLV